MITKNFILLFALFCLMQNSFAQRKAVYDCVIRDAKSIDVFTTKFISTKDTKKLINSKFIVDTDNGSITGEHFNNTYASGIYVSNNGFVEGNYAITSYFGTSDGTFDFISLDSNFISIQVNYYLTKYSHKFIGSITKESSPYTSISGSCSIKDRTGMFSY